AARRQVAGQGHRGEGSEQAARPGPGPRPCPCAFRRWSDVGVRFDHEQSTTGGRRRSFAAGRRHSQQARDQ
ncbi:unnamed protein product, partial [Prorocentrum cordatum]